MLLVATITDNSILKDNIEDYFYDLGQKKRVLKQDTQKKHET